MVTSLNSHSYTIIIIRGINVRKAFSPGRSLINCFLLLTIRYSNSMTSSWWQSRMGYILWFFIPHGPLTKYVKLQVVHAPGMPETFSRVTHVPCCMPGSLTSDFLRSRWRGNPSRHSRRMHNRQFYVSGIWRWPNNYRAPQDTCTMLGVRCFVGVIHESSRYDQSQFQWSNPEKQA